jgi:surface carbohydrate biosynthesis protein
MVHRYLIIPSENRTREFEAKLLLACCAAEAGFRTIVGSRHDIHLSIDRLPRSIYVGKDLRASSALMTRILARLGHHIVAWDEEALVYYTPEQYLAARVHVPVMKATELLFAWGPDNADVWRSHPEYDGRPIQMVGNPRFDLLRPELRGFHQQSVADLHRRFGQYILINSNFGTVNHLLPDAVDTSLRRFRSTEAAQFQAEAFRQRRRLFEEFLAMVPLLAKAFPDRAIVVRPHPSENPEPWLQIARAEANVHVSHEGNVVPWLLCAAAIVHNGCTTAIEASILERACISYQPAAMRRFDIPLPNSLSDTAATRGELVDKLQKHLSGDLPISAPEDRSCLLRRHVAALDGRLSSDRVVSALSRYARRISRSPQPSLIRRWRGRIQAVLRRHQKAPFHHLPDHKNGAQYNQYRFRPLAAGEVERDIDSFRRCLGRFSGVTASHLFGNVFEICNATSNGASR